MASARALYTDSDSSDSFVARIHRKSSGSGATKPGSDRPSSHGSTAAVRRDEPRPQSRGRSLQRPASMAAPPSAAAAAASRFLEPPSGWEPPKELFDDQEDDSDSMAAPPIEQRDRQREVSSKVKDALKERFAAAQMGSKPARPVGRSKQQRASSQGGSWLTCTSQFSVALRNILSIFEN